MLDASALLAYLGNEAGADVVSHAIAGGAVMSAVNLAEVLSTLAARGAEPAQTATDLGNRGLLHGAITVEPFTDADAIEAACLRPRTNAAGLSLADRACLALAHRLATSALTADQAWSSLQIDVEIRSIRGPGSQRDAVDQEPRRRSGSARPRRR